MEMTLIYTVIGFGLAGYSVIDLYHFNNCIESLIYLNDDLTCMHCHSNLEIILNQSPLELLLV